MSPIEPLPFRLRIAGEDVIDLRGIRSVSYRVEGLLHLVDDYLRFEWTATEKTEQVSFTKIGTDVDHSPIGRLEVPVGFVAEARLKKGWVRLRLLLRARSLDAFDGMPGAEAGSITLRVKRRYYRQAKALVADIELARATAPIPAPPTIREIDSGS